MARPKKNIDQAQVERLAGIKQIAGYPNYFVSNDGCVFRRLRVSKGFRKLKTAIGFGGYHVVFIFNDLGRKTFYVHRLVASAFLDEDKIRNQVNHKDGNKLNNSITNLERVTPSENTRHSIEIGTSKSGAKARSSKLSEQNVWDIISLKNTHGSRVVGKQFSVSKTVVLSIWNNQKYKKEIESYGRR